MSTMPEGQESRARGGHNVVDTSVPAIHKAKRVEDIWVLVVLLVEVSSK